MFATLNETVKDTEVIPEKTKKSVNDSLNAGVSDINFTQYHEQVKYGQKVFIVKLIVCLMINLGMSFTIYGVTTELDFMEEISILSC